MARPKRQTNHRTFAEIARLRALYHEHLLGGGTPKEFAMEHGIKLGTGWLYRWSAALGWSSFYVTREEKARVLARRRNHVPQAYRYAA